ncbi:MAG: Gfo/Idh/MocA family protein, partial [Thermomicrobiales bacterium]
MARQVSMGLIGCGKIAKTHAAALASLPESAFSACCDMDVARAESMAEEHGVPNVFGDVQEMLHSGKVDAVCVCTPHPSHAPVVVAAAEAGVHVICEKPLTIDLGEADRMVTAAEQAGIKFAGIFQRRFWPASQKIRQAINSGKLGKLTLGECAVHIWRPEAYYKSDPWRGKWATEGGGVLMNQAVHAIDLFQWYMGPVAEVTGRIATLKHGDYIDVEDTAVATVVFQSGALGVIHGASTANPPLGFRVTVLGDNGATASVWEQPEGSEGMTDLWTVPGEEAYLSV